MNPARFSQMMKYLTRAKKEKPDLPDVTFADKIPQPPVRQDVETMDAINAFIRRERQQKAGGGMLVQPGFGGTRQGYREDKGRPVTNTKLTKKQVQEIYKDLPENVYVMVQERGKNKIPEYTYRAGVRGDRIGKENWRMALKATSENKKKIIEATEKKLNEYYPNRLTREEYAKIRLEPENRRLRGEDFAKKLNEMGYTTATGAEWNRSSVYNFDLESPRTKKRIADDLGFFEKRTVAEAKEIIKRFSGGKHFLKNKNLTDADITTRAASYVAMEKFEETSGTGKSWPRGKQNKRKVWTNIYNSHRQGGRFELINEKELADADGKVNWKKDLNWRKAKFKDKKSGKTFTYDNLEKMVDKHGGGYQKAIKPYNDNAILNQTTFKGKTLNSILTEGLLKKEYETLVGNKVRSNDVGLLKYISEKKPYYSFVEAHHTEGVKDNPFKTEPAFKYANREQGIIQKKYNAAVASGDANKIAQAKEVYVNNMNRVSDELGGIRYKTDGKFIGTQGTSESIVKAAATEAGFNQGKVEKILASFSNNPKCIVTFGKSKAAAEGGRIGYATGPASLTECAQDGARVFNDGKFKTADQVQDAAKLLRGGRAVVSGLMKYGIVPELAYVGLEAAGRTLLGEKPTNALLKSIDTLTFGATDFTSGIEAEKFGKFSNDKLAVDKFRSSQTLVDSLQNKLTNLKNITDQGGEGYVGDLTSDIQMTQAQLQAAEQELQKNTVSPDLVQFIDRREQEIADTQMAKSNFAKQSLKDQMEGIPGIRDYTDTESTRIFPKQPSQTDLNLDLFPSFSDAGYFMNLKTSDAINLAQAYRAQGEDVSAKDILVYRDSLKNAPLSELAKTYGDEQIYGTQGANVFQPLAGGGIAKLAGVSSGVAPVSGPNPQGLLSLKNRVRNY
jgi:hypothetical protein